MAFVATVILLCGVLGGTARYLAYLDDIKEDFDSTAWARYSLLGIVAAAIIPLFLEVVSVGVNEGLVAKLLQATAPSQDVNGLVLIGFCLLAGFYSRNFIESVADGTIKKADKAVATASNALREAKEAAETVSEVQSDAIESAAQEARAGQDVDVPELAVLRAMRDSGYKRPWPSTLAEKTEFDEPQVKEILSKLENKGLVQQRRSSDEGKERWRIRTWGQAVLRKDSTNQG